MHNSTSLAHHDRFSQSRYCYRSLHHEPWTAPGLDLSLSDSALKNGLPRAAQLSSAFRWCYVLNLRYRSRIWRALSAPGAWWRGARTDFAVSVNTDVEPDTSYPIPTPPAPSAPSLTPPHQKKKTTDEEEYRRQRLIMSNGSFLQLLITS